MATFSSRQKIADVRKSHSREVNNAIKNLIASFNNEKLNIESYDIDSKIFSFTSEKGQLTIPAFLLKPVRLTPIDVNLKTLTPDEASSIKFEAFSGKLSDINPDKLDTATIECADGSIELASLDITIFNKLKSLKDFKLKVVEKPTTLVWSGKNSRYYSVPSYIVVVE